MTLNQSPSESVALLDSIDPASQAAGTVTTGWIAVKHFHSVLAVINSGVLGNGATLDAKLRQAQDAAGTGAKDIAGRAITQILKATGDNKAAMINARASDLDAANGFAYVQLSLTVGTAASLAAAHLWGFGPRFQPTKDAGANPAINLGSAKVVQIV